MQRPPGPTTRFSPIYARSIAIPVGAMVVDAQKSAIVSQQQLRGDVQAIEDHNAPINEFNGRVLPLLRQAAGQDLGDDRETWRKWWVDLLGYADMSQKFSQEKTTIVEEITSPYQPQARPFEYDGLIGVRRMSCFGAGTLVRTLRGPEPIETLRIGDRVLAQDLKTGALGYQPILVVHHNPPSPTFLVDVGGDTIVSSPFHRFWVVGRGWVMARNLNGGETLRLLDGPARIASVDPGPVQPVFNLDVDDDHDFFAGAAAALVHDNTLPDLRQEPFDAPPALSAIAPSAK